MSIIKTTKICSICGETKPIDDFQTNRRQCSICRTAKRKESYRRTKENVSTEEETCSTCGETKPPTDFQAGGKKCKDCRAKTNKLYHVKKRKEYESLVGIKKCKNCDQDKDMQAFIYGSTMCRDCVNKSRRYINPSKINIQEVKESVGQEEEEVKESVGQEEEEVKESVGQEEEVKESKICPYCHQQKTVEHFKPKNRRCIECMRALGREYRKSEKGKTLSKVWNEGNKEKLQELKSTWHQKNKVRTNAESKIRYSNDEIYRFRRNCKNLTADAFTDGKNSECIHCSADYLRKWFQFCFYDELTTENYGKVWHIDHVIPVDKFDLTNDSEREICFSWYNTSPLKKEDNLRKNKKILKEQIQRHYDNLKKFGNGIIKAEYEALLQRYLI